MKTKKLMLGMIVILAVAFTSCSQGGEKNTNEKSTTESNPELDGITINPMASKLTWKGEMLGVYSHEGILKITKADLNMEDGAITGGSFSVDMKSMTPTDKNYNPDEGKSPEKLVSHLSSADFFDVENHPTATFVLTSVKGNTAKGNLTVRGVTHEETVENISIAKHGEEGVVISGDLVFDRKNYDVSWDSSMKDMVLSNDISLRIILIGS